MTTNTPTHETPPAVQEIPKRRGLVWLIAFLIVAAIAVYAFIKSGQPGQIVVPTTGRGARGGSGGRGGGLGPVPVVVSKVKRTNVPVYDPALGNVTPYFTSTLKPLVSGTIMSINFQEGDLVKKNQVLFQIDSRPFEVTLKQAQGQLDRDTAQLDEAIKDQTRYASLIKTNAIPQQTLDTQEALVGQLKGTTKADQANIDSANLNILYSKVTAPFDGRCGLRLVDPGNVVTANQTGLLVIDQVQPISVNFTIPQDWLPAVLKKLRAGAKLPVDAWNRDNSAKIETGYLLTVDNVIDPTTGTAKLKAVFKNATEDLFPSQFVNIRLLVDTQQNQLVVPSVAVQTGQQGPFVYVVGSNSRVQLRPVTTGIVSDDLGTQILSGLEEGEQVVVDGTDRLQNNSQVRLRAAGAADAGGRGGRGGRGGSGARGGSGRRGGGGQAGAGADTDVAAAGTAGGPGGPGGPDVGNGRRAGRGGSGRGGRGRRGGGAPE